MSRFYSHINTAITLIQSYTPDTPFAIFIKQFFAANKKYGSQDRRQIASLCYNYFRLGHALSTVSAEEKMLTANFLCTKEPSALMERLKPEWNAEITCPLDYKINTAFPQFTPGEIFPFFAELSDGIDMPGFIKSFLIQPALFIRIRPYKKANTVKKLEKSRLSYKWMGDDCVQMEPGTKVDDFFIVDKEVVIQDYNSQQVFNYLQYDSHKSDWINLHLKTEFSAWDCCAASGGKSILLLDIIKTKINLTISDIRASIISNLHQRFLKAGIKEYKYFIADLGDLGFQLPALDFDLIICDAPCTGSGTWSRTPEQLCFFEKQKIAEYSEQQKKLVINLIPHIKDDGLLVYITCSVFKKENEEIAMFILKKFNCRLRHMELLKGYDKKADSMFVAIFSKT